ncbi:MAG: hypothetical protein MHM6MM_009068, partial [Cercozoa sp. M6MM]
MPARRSNNVLVWIVLFVVSSGRGSGAQDVTLNFSVRTVDFFGPYYRNMTKLIADEHNTLVDAGQAATRYK